jgi:glycosyltransferase involved in cell wall biosynthesis
VLAQDVADARAVAGTDSLQRGTGELFVWMDDRERRVVFDACARVDRTHEIVCLLSGRPGLVRPEAELLVERTYASDGLRAQEDRERDRAVPEVHTGEESAVAGPVRGRAAVGVGGAAGQAVEAGLLLEAPRDLLEQLGSELAVVVGEGHELRADVGKPDIPSSRETAGRAKPRHGERLVPLEYPAQSIVIVLVDHQHAEAAVGLPVEGIEQAPQLVDPVEGGDHEVERRELGLRHGLTLTLVPLISVLLAAHNDSRFLGAAVQSVLRQTMADLELIVVDDASTDRTPALLAAVEDERLVVVTNDEQAGLATSLNRALDRASGRYVARLDADDVAVPGRLERQLARMRRRDEPAVVGSAVLDVDEAGRPGMLHRNPAGSRGVRWLSLFGSPFFHPTVLVDREALDGRRLRYDPSYPESEDYDLWARLLKVADGVNLLEPLVLKRVHAGQASQRRGDLQESLQRQVALREIGRVAPELAAEEAELAWGLGSGRGVADELLAPAAAAYGSLLEAFECHYGIDPEVRAAAARTLAGAKSRREALRLGVSSTARLALRRVRRQVRERSARRDATTLLSDLEAPVDAVRVAVVSPEPTPYRSPLFDRVAGRPEVDLTVIYAARTVAGRTWSVEPHHRARFLRGLRLPGRLLLRHDYPVTPGIGRALGRVRPEVVVISGWSTFASQAAIAWARAHRTPYVLLVESHDLGPRRGWRRVVKGAVVPRLVRAAASVMVVGRAARDSVIARGAAAERVRTFANTVDVVAWGDRADRIAETRSELRAKDGFTGDDVVVLSVARLIREKGLDTLVRAAAASGDNRIRVVVAGGGAGERALLDLAESLGVSLTIRGDLGEEALAEEYAKADVFALLSLHETWGVVVNEASASGLPLVLSERVGAATDLLLDGENGFVVPPGDVDAAAAALGRLAADGNLRRQAGARSRQIVGAWGYEPSVESFVAAVREATSR